MSTNQLAPPILNEDRSKPKSEAEVLESVQKKSLAEEVENDKHKTALYLNRASVAEAIGNVDKGVLKQEQLSRDVYKRALLLVGAGGLEVNSTNGETKQASQNGLPASSYLTHGSRVMVEIPVGSGDDLINWLTSGSKDANGRSMKQTQNQALAEGKVVYNRSAATHGVEIQKQGDQFALKEKRGFSIGAKDFLNNKILGQKTNHFGVDLALNAEFGGKDPQGNKVSKPDGDHGHLYIYYVPATDKKPGSLLIGVEGGAPTSEKHSKTGASVPLSAVDSSKFDTLEGKKKQDSEYQGTIIPKTQGGMVIKLDKERLDSLTQMKASEYGYDLAYAMPADNPEKFKNKLKNQEYHEAKQLQEQSHSAELNSETTKKQNKIPSGLRKQLDNLHHALEESNHLRETSKKNAGKMVRRISTNLREGGIRR
jgi:hypothetical protein